MRLVGCPASAGAGRCRAQPGAAARCRPSAHRRARRGCGLDGRYRRGRRGRQGHGVPPVRQPGGADDGAARRGREGQQEAFLFGPPPLGPDAPPLERLLAFGRERLCFAHTHHALLSAANRDPETRYSAPATLQHTHVRLLLDTAGTTGDLDAQTDALLALLDADYVHHQLTDRGETLESLGDKWESLARKLCGK